MEMKLLTTKMWTVQTEQTASLGACGACRTSLHFNLIEANGFAIRNHLFHLACERCGHAPCLIGTNGVGPVKSVHVSLSMHAGCVAVCVSFLGGL